jgi:uncharacterized protein involved in outer membrane biogenesis
MWVGAGCLALVAIALLALTLIDWNAMRGPVTRFAAARIGRPVAIAGDLDVHVWSLKPTVDVHGLTVGNAPWDKDRKDPMLRVEHLRVEVKLLPLFKGDVILPRVLMEQPDLRLHRNSAGRANWTLGNGNGEAGDAPSLPVIRDFLVQAGKLRVDDDVRKLRFKGTLQAEEKSDRADASAFRIEGDGTLNGRSFRSRISGGPLINLNPDEPYPFKLVVKAGDTDIAADGVVPKPFDLDRLQVTVQASGQDMADLYYLTGLAVPNTPPYKVSAEVRRDKTHLRISDIDGTVGPSDVRGALEVDLSKERPNVTGEISSKALDVQNVLAAMGSRTHASGDSVATKSTRAESTPDATSNTTSPSTSHAAPDAEATAGSNPPPDAGLEGEPADATDASAAAPSEPTPSSKSGSPAMLFPDARLQVNRVRAMDAEVHYKADSLTMGSFTMTQLDTRLKLADGVMSLDPLSFDLPQGRLRGSVKIDARADVPHTQTDLVLEGADLGSLKSTEANDAAPITGPIHARAQVEGDGASVHEFASHATGAITAVVPHGEIRASLAELTGIDVVRALGLLLANDEQRTNVRCGVASFQVQDGVMHAQQIVFDTSDILITGQGEVRLGPEEIALEVRGDPKQPRIGVIHSPVEIKGTLRQPSIGIDAGKAAGQAGIAAALAAIATPLAAILAFVDPGLAEDANCAALLAEAGADDAPAE